MAKTIDSENKKPVRKHAQSRKRKRKLSDAGIDSDSQNEFVKNETDTNERQKVNTMQNNENGNSEILKNLENLKSENLDDKNVKPVRVYADGIFDLFHLGHARMFEQCKKLFPKVHLIVGISDDESTHANKGLTVMTFEERMESVRHCRWVDEVIGHSPWIVDENFMEKHRIDFVAHDPVPYSSESCEDVYGIAKSLGKFKATQRTEGVSTSELINRVVKDFDEFVRRNLKKGYTRKDMNLSFIREQKIKTVGKMDEVKTRVQVIRNKVKNKGDELFDSSINFVERWMNNSQKYIDDFLKLFGSQGKVNKYVTERVGHIEKKFHDFRNKSKKVKTE